MIELPRYISWIKNKDKKEIGIEVRLYIDCVLYRRKFNFLKHGGQEATLKKADDYIESFCKTHNFQRKEKQVPTSDITGVSRTEHIDTITGKEVIKWQATWPSEPGKQVTKRFSVKKHGEEKAKRLAVEAREHAIQSLKAGRDPIFRAPKKDAKLWRYMDFTKLISMFDNSGIFFSQVDMLGDPYEGSYSRGNQKNRKFVYSRQKQPQEEIEALVNKIREKRKGIMISCWHHSSYESAAMWKLYAKSNEAICIQTTYSKLASVIDSEANIGMVKYLDYENNWIPESSIYYPFMYKRKSFEHENELRVILDLDNLEQKKLLKSNRFGYWKQVDLNYLIEKIYVSPDSPRWFLDLTKNICQKYKIECEVINSKLNGSPIY